MNATVCIIVMAVTGLSGALAVLGMVGFDILSEWAEEERYQRLFGPGEW